MSEWLKEPASKTGVRVSVPGVRIPSSPQKPLQNVLRGFFIDRILQFFAKQPHRSTPWTRSNGGLRCADPGNRPLPHLRWRCARSERVLACGSLAESCPHRPPGMPQPPLHINIDSNLPLCTLPQCTRKMIQDGDSVLTAPRKGPFCTNLASSVQEIVPSRSLTCTLPQCTRQDNDLQSSSGPS